MTRYANKRAEGIALLRQWTTELAEQGEVRQAHLGLQSAMQALIEEFRVAYDVPGTRYWLHTDSDTYFSTAPGELFSFNHPTIVLCVELARHEFLSRQRLHFGYEDRL